MPDRRRRPLPVRHEPGDLDAASASRRCAAPSDDSTPRSSRSSRKCASGWSSVEIPVAQRSEASVSNAVGSANSGGCTATTEPARYSARFSAAEPARQSASRRVEVEAVEGAGGRERLELLGGEPDPAHEVVHVAVRTARSRSATIRSASSCRCGHLGEAEAHGEAPSRRCSACIGRCGRRPTGAARCRQSSRSLGQASGLSSASSTQSPERRMSGRRTSTPCRRASPTRVAGE